MDLDDTRFVGLPIDEATALAEREGWHVRAYEPGAMLTMDYREDRLNLEHVDGVVTRARAG